MAVLASHPRLFSRFSQRFDHAKEENNLTWLFFSKKISELRVSRPVRFSEYFRPLRSQRTRLKRAKNHKRRRLRHHKTQSWFGGLSSLVHRAEVEREILQCVVSGRRARLPRIADDVEHEAAAVVAHRHQFASKALFLLALLLLHQCECFLKAGSK